MQCLTLNLFEGVGIGGEHIQGRIGKRLQFFDNIFRDFHFDGAVGVQVFDQMEINNAEGMELQFRDFRMAGPVFTDLAENLADRKAAAVTIEVAAKVESLVLQLIEDGAIAPFNIQMFARRAGGFGIVGQVQSGGDAADGVAFRAFGF